MVPLLIAALSISIVGMLVLITAKHYELSTGRLMFASSRPRIAKFSGRMVFLFGTAVPLYLRWQAGRLYSFCTSFVHKGVARGAVVLEHWLERVLSKVRQKTSPTRAPGEASAFLREVGEYKKQLSDGSSDNRIE